MTNEQVRSEVRKRLNKISVWEIVGIVLFIAIILIAVLSL